MARRSPVAGRGRGQRAILFDVTHQCSLTPTRATYLRADEPCQQCGKLALMCYRLVRGSHSLDVRRLPAEGAAQGRPDCAPVVQYYAQATEAGRPG